MLTGGKHARKTEIKWNWKAKSPCFWNRKGPLKRWSMLPTPVVGPAAYTATVAGFWCRRVPRLGCSFPYLWSCWCRRDKNALVISGYEINNQASEMRQLRWASKDHSSSAGRLRTRAKLISGDHSFLIRNTFLWKCSHVWKTCITIFQILKCWVKSRGV